MKSSDLLDLIAERDELAAKKRLGKNQKTRLAALSKTIDTVGHPLPTPRRTPVGLDANGFAAGDRDGSAWRNHVGARARSASGRYRRRAIRFGRNGIRPLRSRIQRQERKQRTGGVK